MSVLGIVAEYDPFHNGHLHHLRESVSVLRPDAVLAVLSGPFKQRGEPALLSPFLRADCAVSAGVDAVFALPVLWTLRDAEHYALGAVSLLASLGADTLAFGAETADLSLLQAAADLLEDPPPAFRGRLHSALAEGMGYPAAVSEAAGFCRQGCGEVLARPNNILAVCYLRVIRRLYPAVKPLVIPREGSYRSDWIDPAFPSASALREAFSRGAWQQALPALPSFSASAVRPAFLSQSVPDARRLDALLLSRLRSMSGAEAAALPDCTEGLDAALLKAAAHAGSREDLLAALTSRRYPAARISRLCACALLGITAERMNQAPLPDRALLLAIKKNPSLTGSWKNSPVRVSAASGWRKTADPEDLAAWRIWALACGLPADFPFTEHLRRR